jgi:predicted alpha/beta hydrolase
MLTTSDAEIECNDGLRLTGTFHIPEHDPIAVVVIGNALGVPRRFYAKFSSYLAENGFATLTFDYRGSADSLDREAGARGFDLAQWGERDIQAALVSAGKKFPWLPLHYLGHSCGGQLLGLAPDSTKLTSIVLIAATMPQAKFWSFPKNLGLWFLWRIVIPLAAAGRKFFPARALKLGSGDLPVGVVRQWADWALSDGYLFSRAADQETGRYAALRVSLLCVHATDDTYAPPAAVRAMRAHYSGCKQEEWILDPDRVSGRAIGHLGYFKQNMKTSLWRDLVRWLNNQAGTAAVLEHSD